MEIFHGAQLRLDRAAEHLAQLQSSIEVFRQEYKDGFSFEFDSETEQLRMTAQNETGEPWPMLSVLVGEVVYNVRAALDYFVYELAFIDSGKPQRGTQFPIESTPEGFARRRKTFLKGVSDEHVALIERLQPHAGCQWTKILALLSNPDKHMHLTVLANMTESVAKVSKGEFGAFDHVATGQVFRAESGPNPGDVHVDFSVSIRIAFPEGPEVVETLEVLKTQVSQALQGFKADIQA
jgi:hypothetical protein